MIKVFSQLLGRYSSNKKPLILFRLDESLLYRLSDIQPLFGLDGIDYSQFEDCYRDSEDIYLNTGVLHSYAVEKSCQRLAELSKLKADDFQAGLADEILDTFPEFKRTPKEDQVWEAVQLPFERLSAPLVKSEPLSPPTLKSTDNRNPMALDKVLLNTTER
jgi:hypothetical protein